MSFTVGFIGLGIMGQPMAANLARGGHRVRGYDLNPDSAALLRDVGVEAVGSLAETAADAEVIVTMLPDTPDVETVLMGPEGLIQHAAPGTVIVDMSTISASATRRMAEELSHKGISLLDAPVSGGVKGAQGGTLSIMVGGDAGAFERALPVLSLMGKTIVHVGASGTGQVFKACNQLICATNIQAICEAFALCRAAGGDLEKLREVLLGGSAASWMLDNLGPQILAKDDRAGFRIDLQLKDLRLAGEAAQELAVPLPGLALATSLYLEAKAHGEGGNGNQALFRVYDRLTGQSTT